MKQRREFMRTPRSDVARPPVINMKTESGVRKFEAIANEGGGSGAGIRRSVVGEHGDGLVRSPFLQKMFGDTLYEAFSRDQADVRSGGLFNPGKSSMRRGDVEPQVRREVHRAESANVFQFLRVWWNRGRSGNVQRRRGVPQETRPERCVHSIWRRARKRIRRAAARTFYGWRFPASLTKQDLVMRACSRLSICAWNAARVSRSARWAWTWRATRAEFLPTTIRATERLSRRACWEISIGSRNGQPLLAVVEPGARALLLIHAEKTSGVAARDVFRWPRAVILPAGAASRCSNDTFTNHFEPKMARPRWKFSNAADARSMLSGQDARAPFIARLLPRRRQPREADEGLFPSPSGAKRFCLRAELPLGGEGETRLRCCAMNFARKARVSSEACELWEFAAVLDCRCEKGPNEFCCTALSSGKSMGMLGATKLCWRKSLGHGGELDADAAAWPGRLDTRITMFPW